MIGMAAYASSGEDDDGGDTVAGSTSGGLVARPDLAPSVDVTAATEMRWVAPPVPLPLPCAVDALH